LDFNAPVLSKGSASGTVWNQFKSVAIVDILGADMCDDFMYTCRPEAGAELAMTLRRDHVSLG
jgi:hypothetical protein